MAWHKIKRLLFPGHIKQKITNSNSIKTCSEVMESEGKVETKLILKIEMCSFRKYPCSPHKRD